jgi:hypothetical protein
VVSIFLFGSIETDVLCNRRSGFFGFGMHHCRMDAVECAIPAPALSATCNCNNDFCFLRYRVKIVSNFLQILILFQIAVTPLISWARKPTDFTKKHNLIPRRTHSLIQATSYGR